MSLFEQIGFLGTCADGIDKDLAAAQELCWEAYDTSSSAARKKLAQKAIKTSPNCADGYVILAQECKCDLKKQLELWEKGVEAGIRSIGDDVFKKDRGYFWGLIETRPYMRARQGLSQCLWELGKQDEAIAHAQEMLELNPGDNQGVRYYLLAWLVEQEVDGFNRESDINSLFEQYSDEDYCDWTYTYALWLFHKGRAKEAKDTLKIALTSNKYIPDYLLDKKQLPRSIPSEVIWQSPEEAITYSIMFGELWSKVPNAKEWLFSVAKF